MAPKPLKTFLTNATIKLCNKTKDPITIFSIEQQIDETSLLYRTMFLSLWGVLSSKQDTDNEFDFDQSIIEDCC